MSHPSPGSDLQYDRDIKLPLYARAGIPEAWLVDLELHTLTRHREPGPDGYRRSEVVADLAQVTRPVFSYISYTKQYVFLVRPQPHQPHSCVDART